MTLDMTAVRQRLLREDYRALGQMGDDALLPLITIVNDTDITTDVDYRRADVVARAVDLLGSMNNPAAIPALAKRLNAKERHCSATTVIDALAQCGTAAVEPLIRYLFLSPTLDWLHSQGTWYARKAMRKALWNLFGMHAATTAVRAASFEYFENSQTGEKLRWRRGAIDISASDQGVRELCMRRTTFSNNLLHLVSDKKDISVSISVVDQGDCVLTTSVQHQRDWATEELQARASGSAWSGSNDTGNASLFREPAIVVDTIM